MVYIRLYIDVYIDWEIESICFFNISTYKYIVSFRNTYALIT